MEFSSFQLDNGIRVIHQFDKSVNTVHCGFLIKAGSRDETAEEHGLAHLIEHCLFKGTQKRKAFHILNRIDSVGGELNAYTTKEETCVFSSALREHFTRSAELLFDIVFSPMFPEREIEKEKQVILDEINAYKDAPDEMLFDDFEQYLFDGHSIGRSILGAEKVINNLGRSQLIDFVGKHYATDRIVFSVVGNVSPRQLERFCAQYLEQIPTRKYLNGKRVRPQTTAFDKLEKRPVHQCHTIVGSESFALDQDERKTMVLLNNILGGPAMNSRLNLHIRERYGFCYHIESGYHAYSDTGIFQVYFGTDQKHHARTLRLVKKELERFIDEPLTPRALSNAQGQLIGQVALARENRANHMLSLGKAVLHFGQADTFEDFVEDVHSITSQEIQEVAARVFDGDRMSSLAFFPENA